MHLEEQKYVLNTFKVNVEILRVKNNNSSKKQGKLVFGNTMQPWQNGAVKTCVAVPMMYDDLYKQYGMKGMRTAKLNQASEKFNFYIVLNDTFLCRILYNQMSPSCNWCFLTKVLCQEDANSDRCRLAHRKVRPPVDEQIKLIEKSRNGRKVDEERKAEEQEGEAI